jgi:hypothetical protein
MAAGTCARQLYMHGAPEQILWLKISAQLQAQSRLPPSMLFSDRDFTADDYEALLALDEGIDNRKGVFSRLTVGISCEKSALTLHAVRSSANLQWLALRVWLGTPSPCRLVLRPAAA